MSLRKRPVESSSRGHSPPDKRTRLSERPASIQDRYASSLLSTGSEIDYYRPRTTRDAADRSLTNMVSRPVSGNAVARHDWHVTSTGGNGSGGSTPVQVAPPVPKMLPVSGGNSYTSLLQQQEQAARQRSPHSMASLHAIRDRKKTMADHARPVILDNSSTTSSSSARLQTQIESQEREISDLKKYIDTLSAQMAQQESLSQRLEALEGKNPSAQLTPRSDKIDKLEAAASKEAKDHDAITNEVKTIKTALGEVSDLKKDIHFLKSWKATQSNAFTKDKLQEITTKLDKADTSLVQLTSRLDEDKKTIASLLDFKTAIEEHKMSHQLSNLWNRVKDIGANEDKTYKKATSIESRVKLLNEDFLASKKVIGQVSHIQSSISRITNSLSELNPSHDQLTTRVAALENNAGKVPALTNSNKRLDQFSTDIKHLLQEVKKINKSTAEIRQEMQDHIQTSKVFEARLSAVEAHPLAPSNIEVPAPTLTEQMQSDIKDIKDMKLDIASLSESIVETEEKFHMQSLVIEGLQEDLPALFTEKFDPFKRIVEQQIGAIETRLPTRKSDATRQPSPSSIQAQQPQLDDLMRGMIELKTEHASLGASVAHKFTVQENDIRGIKRQLSSKAETVSMNQQMDANRVAIQGIQGQLDNITTDTLYQQMVHWFVQTYPAAQTLLQQFPATQQAITQLQAFTAKVSWLPPRLQDLQDLLQSGSPPTAKAEVQQTAEQEVKSLRYRIEEGFVDERRARQELETALGQDRDQRLKAEESFRSTQARLEKLRDEFDHVYDTFIEPNTAIFKVLGVIVVFLFDCQRNLELVNAGLKKKIEFSWSEDLRALLEGAEGPGDRVNSEGNGKGKDRDKP